MSNPDEITVWFQKWLDSEDGVNLRKVIADEKRQVKELIQKLSKMDRSGEEFTNLVLYGLLPYYDTQFAKRTSTFPVFVNIRTFFKKYNYSEKEWNIVANMIFLLAENFQKEPEKLGQLIEEFTTNKIYSRNLQCGAITPILFCINDSFPLINNKIIDTYRKFSDKLNWGDKISYKLEDYMDNIPKYQKLMSHIGIEKMDYELFDLFCWSFDKINEQINHIPNSTNKDVSASTSPKPSDPVKKEFSEIDSWSFVRQRIHKLPPPDLQSIDSIIDNIQKGKYAIPVFQREYTWTRKQVEELWESIFQGFFIGSILTWDYDDQIDTIPAQGAPSLQNPTNIILDGQQRITSLFHTVAPPDTSFGGKRMLFFVDLKAMLDPSADTTDIVFSEYEHMAKKYGYLERKNQFTRKIFPLTQFYHRNYTLWLVEFRTYLKEVENLDDKADEYYDQILGILDHVWFKYVIPVVQLPRSLSLDSVAEIFEKINSTGTRLGVFDLLNARFTKYDVNLHGLWDEAKSNSAEIQDMDENFNDATKYTLQGLCLFKKGYTRRKELLTLDDAYKKSRTFQKEEFLREWFDICRYVSAAIAKLKSHREDGFGAVALWMTPYTVIVPILAALMYTVDGRNDMPKCMSKIQNWYWSVVTSDSYSGSTDTKVERDYRELLLWFDDDMAIPRIVIEQRDSIDSLEINTIKTNDSIYKTVVCLVSKMGANDFLTDRASEYSTLVDHHIFPKSLAPKYKSTVHINSILNRTVLDSNTNRNFLMDKTPAEYIKEIIKEQEIEESTMRKRLKTHLISDDAFDCLLNNNFDGFVHARADTIRAELHKLVVPSGEPDDPRLSLLHTTESQHLEYKSTLRWDLKLEKRNTSLEDVISKELCAFMNSEGGDLLIGVDDAGNPIGLEKDYSTLKMKNYDGFVQHLTNMINKYLGKTNNTYVEFEPIQTKGMEICLCRIKQAQSPVFFNKDGEKKFFIRANNTCQPLDAEDAYKYITQHWD